MKILYLAGCGLYIESNNTGILVDGLYTSCQGFSEMPAAVQTGIFSHEAPFLHLKKLLFTHQHSDHCDRNLFEKYLHQYPETEYFLPSKYMENLKSWKKDGIYAFPTWHLPSDTYKIAHFSYIIEGDNERVLILGDAYPTKCRQILSECHNITYAFVNPYFLKLPSGREILEKICPEKCYVYHIPYLKDDSYGMQKLVKQWHERYQNSTILLPEKCQFPEIILGAK